jgi:hypothetical protein
MAVLTLRSNRERLRCMSMLMMFLPFAPLPMLLNVQTFYSNRPIICMYGYKLRVLGYRSGVPGLIPGPNNKKVVGLERGPLRLVSTNEELFDRKVAGSCLENREYGRRDPSR